MIPAENLSPEKKSTTGAENKILKDPTKNRTQSVVKLLILILLYYVIVLM
jgi:hypothetical protein